MRSTILRFSAIAFVLVLAACAAIQQQKSQPVRADQGQFKNLKVLPQTITHDELIATMRGFTRALGVKCDHCHERVTPPPGSQQDMNYASDAKPEKGVARQMIRMVNDVNTRYLSQINPAGENVQCMTCHRGKRIPDVTLPEAPHPPQAPTPPPTPPAPQP
jgi:hypothetical protein